MTRDWQSRKNDLTAFRLLFFKRFCFVWRGSISAKWDVIVNTCCGPNDKSHSGRSNVEEDGPVIGERDS